jgi:hypothetical protein
VTLAPGAEENGLALMLAELLRENLAERPGKRWDFGRLDGRVGVVARDADVALTLEFLRGQVRVHDGLLSGRALTIITESEKITQLSLINLRYGLPVFHDATGRGVVKDLARGRIRIEGLLRHPLMLVHLTRLLSVNGD